MRKTVLPLLMPIAAVVFCSFSFVPDRPAAQDKPAPQAAPARAIAEDVRESLAERLNVETAVLTNDTDLVSGLMLDPTDVYYAVIEVLKAFGIKKPAQEMTRVGDIIAAVEAAKGVPVFKKRSLSASAPQTTYVQTVYFATDRKATGNAEPELMFSGERAAGGEMSYGRAEVNIPYTHKRGQIETPWLELKQLRDPGLHIYVMTLEPKDEATFFNDLTGGSQEDILLYIHGFNVTFENALQRAAQISFDFGFKGTPVVFTWPSYAGVTGYNTDWENVNWATQHIESFINKLTAQAHGRKIHVIAHSMGNKGFLNALMRIAQHGAKGPLFQSAILCAPDYDAGMFREQVAAEIRPLSKQWVVYSSNKDIALLTSERLNTPRLGQPVTFADGYEIIDASGVEVTPWSVPETHSYYAAKKVVLDDMVKVLSGVTANARGLNAKVVGGDTVWSFK